MYNYFNYDGVQVNGLALVTKIEKPYIPEKSISTIDITSRDGYIYEGSRYSNIKIPISLAIIGDNEKDYQERVNALKDLFESKEIVPIKFAPNTSIYGMMHSDFVVNKKNSSTGYCDIEIVCFDPYTYSDNVLLYENEEGKKLLVVNNGGKKPTLPFISVGFSKDAHFAQIENKSTGERILVGDYPKLQLPQKAANSLVVYNRCESLSDITVTGANIDAGRSTGGTLALSSTGKSYILADIGSGTAQWKGACARISIPSQLDEFELRINMQHKSTGKNGDPTHFDEDLKTYKETVESGTKSTYYQVTCSVLNVRSGPGTKYKKIGSVSKGYKITKGTLSKGWVKFTYKGKTGYCAEKYLVKKTSDGTVSTVQTYTVKNMMVLPDSGTRVSGGVGVMSSPKQSSTRRTTVPYGTIVRVMCKDYNETYKDEQGKTQVRATFYKLFKPYVDANGKKFTGYIGKQYLVSATGVNQTVDYEDDPAYADDKTGIVELYGFDVNGNQLFKMGLLDDNEYFEYTRPIVRIGNREVLTDTHKAPVAADKIIANQNGITTSKYLGGAYGDWNNFDGTFILKREKINKQYVWNVTVNKLDKDRKIVKTQKTNNIRYTDLPTAELSYLAFYLGTMAANTNKLSGVGLSHVSVYNLNPQSNVEEDIIYFHEGDVLDLDFATGNAYLNEVNCNNLVDVGSSYFPLDTGETEIALNSDDSGASISVAVQEKWLGVVDEDIATIPTNMEDE